MPCFSTLGLYYNQLRDVFSIQTCLLFQWRAKGDWKGMKGRTQFGSWITCCGDAVTWSSTCVLDLSLNAGEKSKQTNRSFRSCQEIMQKCPLITKHLSSFCPPESQPRFGLFLSTCPQTLHVFCAKNSQNDFVQFYDTCTAMSFLKKRFDPHASVCEGTP